MTAAALTFDTPRSDATVAICAGRVLLLAGLAFGSANLFQWAVLGGALDLHPAVLGLSWPVAVGVFLIGLVRLRRAGGEAGRRVAGWSRAAVLIQIAVALTLAAAGYATGDWGLMRWAAVAGLVLYAVVWAVAAVRNGSSNMGVLFLVALGGAAAAATRFGTPDQNLIQAFTLALAALLPGLWLANGRRL
ncbi:hypothetical protein [Brevundimonas sp.]|uniref:hypothetical protein n=1 Tax=Brevundimonas sp. TaxID=1871086 RepID=UPI002737F714|nr:hypothetical protein [Brevundimonas sp.]MDP3803283.1 hypothetical protein [Brevundimonas sp.]